MTTYQTTRKTLTTVRRVDAEETPSPAPQKRAPRPKLSARAKFEIIEPGADGAVLFDGIAPRPLAEQMQALCVHHNAKLGVAS